MKIYLDSELCRLIYCRHFEHSERMFLMRFLRPGDTFVDIGANVGLFALIAGSVLRDQGQVFAFEPTPETYRRLVENVRLNGLENVTCVQAALSAEAGEAEISKSTDGFDAWNSLGRPTMGAKFSGDRVATLRWDDYAIANSLTGRVTMIKIDVEGWEKNVLIGAREALTQADAPILQVEFAEEAALAAGSSCRELYALLESYGYRLCVFDPAADALLPDPLRDSYASLNLFAVKDLDFVHSRLRAAV